MKKVTLIISLIIAFGQLLTAQTGRILRFQVNQMSTNTYDIKNTGPSNTFLNANNWRIVDPATGAVTGTTATPSNNDTLQVFYASISLSTNFDMTALQNIVLDFGDPRSGLSWSLLVKRDNTWLLHSTAKINVRWGDLVTEQDNVAPINTGIKIGGVNKLLASSTGTITVHGPSYATSATPETVSFLQEGFLVGYLPVVLVSFDAVKQSNGVRLVWKTQQEYNTKAFHIERSTDGVNFIPVGSVAAAGNATTPRLYTYTDAAPVNTVAYYRVRIVNYDNLSGFTPVKAVRASVADTRMSLYPNPSSGMTNIIINNPESLAFTVNVFNRSGQLVSRRNLSGGSNSIAMDLGNLPVGDYTVDVQLSNGSHQSSKLIISRQ